MSSLRLTWTPISSYHMTYATVLGYVFEVHASSVPLFGPPESYTVMCRHLHVVDGPQRTKIGEYGSEDEGKLAAEAWLGEQLQALGLGPQEAAVPHESSRDDMFSLPATWKRFEPTSPMLGQEDGPEQWLGTAFVAGLAFMDALGPYITNNDDLGLITKNRDGENTFIIYNKRHRHGVRLDKEGDVEVFKVMTGTLSALEKNEGASILVARSELRDQAKLVAKRYLAN